MRKGEEEAKGGRTVRETATTAPPLKTGLSTLIRGSKGGRTRMKRGGAKYLCQAGVCSMQCPHGTQASTACGSSAVHSTEGRAMCDTFTYTYIHVVMATRIWPYA